MPERSIARPAENGREAQLVIDHVKEAAFYASKFASHFNLHSSGELIGLLHDFGKNNQQFQDYIHGRIVRKNGGDHSTAGAQFLKDNMNCESSQLAPLVYQILALCIASHHGGLIDCLSPAGKNKFAARISKSDAETFLSSARNNADQDLLVQIHDLIGKGCAIDEVELFLLTILRSKDSDIVKYFNLGLLCRVLFSSLIDADRLSAAGRENSETPDWGKLLVRLENKLASFDRSGIVNKIRHEISQACYEFAGKGKGIFKLPVPTGGGKTFSSLRYALRLARLQKMDRIIYVIPYTSIIEQNAQEVRNVLERDGEPLVVLEHHSNIITEKKISNGDEVEEDENTLLSENWDAPIVFTTSVQFLNALFDGSTRSSRRMHRLSNAVVIFDEIQTLPIKTVHLFNIAANFLTEHCNSSMIMCTATQPLLENVDSEKGALKFSGDGKNCEISPPDIDLFKQLKRVELRDCCKVGGFNEDELKSLIIKKCESKGNVLTVTNSRTWAKNLYSRCAEDFEHTYHLSAAMCPAHRTDVISTIKHRIKPEISEPTICISTQLIEAGVDVDFNSGIRFLAGLDSMAQAAGRVNRNGNHPTCQVSIVNPDVERIDNLKDIKTGKEVAERVLREFRADPKLYDEDILSPKLMDLYYLYYFYDRSGDMDYKVGPCQLIERPDTLLSLLSTNSNSVNEYKGLNSNKVPPMGLRQSFKTAGQLFQAIDSPTTTVVVPYGGDGQNLIAELCARHFDPAEMRGLLRSAQRFCVNIYEHEFKRLMEEGALHSTYEESHVYVLKEEYYDKNLGIVLETANELSTLLV